MRILIVTVRSMNNSGCTLEVVRESQWCINLTPIILKGRMLSPTVWIRVPRYPYSFMNGPFKSCDNIFVAELSDFAALTPCLYSIYALKLHNGDLVRKIRGALKDVDDYSFGKVGVTSCSL